MDRLLLLFLVSLFTPCDSHLCLMNPRQRGDMDISTSGSHTCTRHGAPCGGEAAVTPTSAKYSPGEQVFIQWQQNFNHYEVGYPGYMDIAIAPVGNDDFQTLAFVPDKYVFAQDYQHNYSAIVTLPNNECAHCVIRARYQAHKPGETTFYQCADIKIEVTSKSSLPTLPMKIQERVQTYPESVKKFDRIQRQRPLSKSATMHMLQGLAFNDFEQDRLHFVNVSLTNGDVMPLNTLHLGVDVKLQKLYKTSSPRTSSGQAFLLDGIAALNPGQGEMLTLLHNNGSMENITRDVMVFFTINGTVEVTLPLQNFDGTPIIALIYVRPRTYVSFGIQSNPAKPGTFYFVMGQVSYVPGTGLVYKRLYMTTQPEDLYVNFQWAEFNPDSGILHVLMGNENAPDTLDARIYTFDYGEQTLDRVVRIQTSDFTFMSMQIHRTDDMIYAVAPAGKYSEKRPAYNLVKIDPRSGNVTSVFKIAEAGIFERYYGGTIFNGFDQENGVVYKVLRLADTVADIILAIDIREKVAYFSKLCNLRHIHNLSLSPL